MTRSDRVWEWLMQAWGPTCHQLPERSFFWGRYQFPVCARCTGVGIGETAGVALALGGSLPRMWLGAVLCTIMLADWTVQWLGIRTSSNWRRLVTGIAGGLGIVAVLVGVVRWVIGWTR